MDSKMDNDNKDMEVISEEGFNSMRVFADAQKDLPKELPTHTVLGDEAFDRFCEMLEKPMPEETKALLEKGPVWAGEDKPIIQEDLAKYTLHERMKKWEEGRYKSPELDIQTPVQEETASTENSAEIDPRIFERSTVYKLGLFVKQQLMGSKNLSEKEFMHAAKEFIYKYEDEFEELAHTEPGEDDFFDRIVLPCTQENTNVAPLALSYRGISSTPQWDDEGKYAYGKLKTPYPDDFYGYSGKTMYELEYDFMSLVDDCFGIWYAGHCKKMREEGLPVDGYGTPYREIVCIANPETDYWISQEAKRCNMPKKTIANALLAYACSRGVRLDLTEDFYAEGDFYHYQFGILDELEFGNINGDTATLYANDFAYPRIDLVISWADGKTVSFSDMPDDRILIETFLSSIARYRKDPAWTELSKYARKPLRGRFPRKDEEGICRNKEGVLYKDAYKKIMVACAVELGIIPDKTEASVEKLLKQVEKHAEE